MVGVLLYHGGVSWAGGGFLGVEVFFVLSGFLITSLLVVEWSRSSTIALGAFWARRARRLLPALFCLVTVIGIYYALAGSSKAVPGLKGDGIATLLYFGNWNQILTQSSYFAATGPVSPLQHTWSLAIEEQFYIFWPVLLFGVLWLAGRVTSRRSPWELRALLAFSVLGAVGSAIEMALLFDGGRGLNRVYYGTDTRAFSLLTGVVRDRVGDGPAPSCLLGHRRARSTHRTRAGLRCGDRAAGHARDDARRGRQLGVAVSVRVHRA